MTVVSVTFPLQTEEKLYNNIQGPDFHDWFMGKYRDHEL